MALEESPQVFVERVGHQVDEDDPALGMDADRQAVGEEPDLSLGAVSGSRDGNVG